MKISPFLIGALIISSLVSLTGQAAPKDQSFYRSISAEPSTLNPITSSDAYASAVQGHVLDSLLTRNEDTYEWLPALAEKWEISKDGTVFTFKIRDGVTWSDGKPLSVDDIKFSFDVYFEGKFKAPHKAVYLSGIKEAKVIDPKTIQFITKEVYFLNFDTVAGLEILPKHFYQSAEPNDPKFNKLLIGTGPYVLESWEKGQKLVLKKNPRFWGKGVPYFKDRFNFDRVIFKPVKDETVAVEMLKKGDTDFQEVGAEQFKTKMETKEFKERAVPVQTQNSAPQNFSYGYIGWNQMNPLFKDREVRTALSQLINRDLMIEKFLMGTSEKAVGPFGNKSPATSKKVKPIEYNPKAAMEALKKKGWELKGNDLVKVINGAPTKFEFTLITANPDFEKYLTLIKEDMRKVGITLNIKILEWNSFLKLVDERKFDAVNMGWQVNGLEPDPKQIWHSSAIPTPGNNFVGYSNSKVDKMTDEMRGTMDKVKRQKLLNLIHEEIATDQPYSFLFNKKFVFYGHSKSVRKKKDTFKYSIGLDTWTLQR